MERSPLRELGDLLRPAVEQVRREPMPADSLDRAVARARKLGNSSKTTRPTRPWAALRLVASVAVAATLLIVVISFQGQRNGYHARPLASDEAPPSQKVPDRFNLAIEIPASLSTHPRANHSLPFDRREDDWRRIRGLRSLTGGMSRVDREGVENYLRRLSPSSTLPKVWRQEARQPTVARVVTGAGDSLPLVSVRVTVVIDGPRARTIVDHVFRNPSRKPIDGIFESPLPAGASPVYFALYRGKRSVAIPPLFRNRKGSPEGARERLAPCDLTQEIDTDDWGKRNEAVLAAPRQTRSVQSAPVRRAPAGSENIPGFHGAVTSLAAKAHSRIIFAYEQFLPLLACGTTAYHFVLPGCNLEKFTFSLTADAGQWQDVQFLPRHRDDPPTGAGQLIFRRTWTRDTPKGSLLFSARPANPVAQVGSARPDPKGPCYVCVSVRPKVPIVRRKNTPAKQAIFLLDTSRSEHPDRFAVNTKLLQSILANDDQVEQFNILTFNVAAQWVAPKNWLPNTAQGRKSAIDRLDGVRLEGATDLSCALNKLLSPGFKIGSDSPVEIFLLSDGRINWGDTSPGVVERFFKNVAYPVRFHCYRLGLGDDNHDLFAALTRRGGGIWRCGSEQELPRVALAHRREGLMIDEVRFQSGPAAREVFVAGRQAAVYFGGELLVVGQLAEPGKTNLVIKGTCQGKPITQTFPLEITGKGELAERAWAEVAVAQLLALDDPEVEPLATAYCQQFGIASRVAVLQIPLKAEVVQTIDLASLKKTYAPKGLQNMLTNVWVEQAKPEGKAWVSRLVRRALGEKAGEVKGLLELLTEADCRLPESRLPPPKGGELSEGKTDVLAEALRRYNKGDIGGAVCVLSGLLEQHPDSPAMMRLVACRLMEMKQPAQAARLFLRVAQRHPEQIQAHRDLARALEAAHRPVLAALIYEMISVGLWEGRRIEAIRRISGEDYVLLVDRIKNDQTLTPAQRRWLAKRQPTAKWKQPALRVVLTWTTEGNDLDLRVTEPDGTRVTPTRPSSIHGELSADQTDGFGPERYLLRQPVSGEYLLEVHYSGSRTTTETYAQVTVQIGNKTQYHGMLLSRSGQTVTICRIKLP